jgi:hypothetical protein
MILYTVVPISVITEEILNQCTQLFSTQYGTWSPRQEDQDKLPPGVKGGSRITVNSIRLRTEYLFNDKCGLCIATLQNQLIGHAFFTTFEIS